MKQRSAGGQKLTINAVRTSSDDPPTAPRAETKRHGITLTGQLKKSTI